MEFGKKNISPLTVKISSRVGGRRGSLIRRVCGCRFLLLAVLVSAGLACPMTAAGGKLTLAGGQNGEDQQAIFTLAVQNASNSVAAFRLDIDYDVTVLRFQKAVAGPLAAGKFALFRAFNQAPGVVRIGGVAPQSPAIKKNDTGVLVKLFFEVRNSGGCDLAITELRNDMRHWQAGSCRFEAVQPAAGSGRDAEEAGSQVYAEGTDEAVGADFLPAAGLRSGYDDESMAATGNRQEDNSSGTNMSANQADVTGDGQSPGPLSSGNTAAFFPQRYAPPPQRGEFLNSQTAGQAGLPAQGDPGAGSSVKSSRHPALPTAESGENNRETSLADTGHAIPNPWAKNQSMAAGPAGSWAQENILPSWEKFFSESLQPAVTLSLQTITLLILLRLLQEFKRRQRKMEHLLARVVSPSKDGMTAQTNESYA